MINTDDPNQRLRGDHNSKGPTITPDDDNADLESDDEVLDAAKEVGLYTTSGEESQPKADVATEEIRGENERRHQDD